MDVSEKEQESDLERVQAQVHSQAFGVIRQEMAPSARKRTQHLHPLAVVLCLSLPVTI